MTRHLVLFYNSAKYHQNIQKGIPVTEQTGNLFQTKQKNITPKVRKPELSVLYTTCHLVLFYSSTKYHKNIPKDLFVRTQKGDNTKSKKGTVVILVCDMSPGPVLHFYHV